ncbi:SIS domain-containing protein [Pediococcus siamensis]|uniref:SIS domain-containing protein n=1 Tax=Pediococcus siamensis TaxID=381829 RepID=UPI0039A2A0F1
MEKSHQIEIEKAVNALKKSEQINHIYLVACGGSLAFLQPLEYIFSKEIEIPVSLMPAREFTTRHPKALGPQSLVIACSHSGSTPETVEAVQTASDMGATTVAFAFAEESDLQKAAQYTIHYSWGKGTDASDLNTGVAYAFTFDFLNAIVPNEKFVRGRKAIEKLEKTVERVRKQFGPTTAEWTKELKREPLIYSVASGVLTGQAYSFAACWLQEMQWINAGYIHSGEYFHGPFEVTDYDVPFIIAKSVGPNRVMDERAADFAKRFSGKVYEIDIATFDMSDIDEDLQDYFSQILAGAVYRQIAEGFAYQRGHSLDVRRYMWNLKY